VSDESDEAILPAARDIIVNLEIVDLERAARNAGVS
jgi:hypothetical protein